MSVARQRARGLVGAYQLSLERQIEGRGSSLASSDEELWRQVEAQLREGGAEETHCLGLDALSVMEESLEAAASAGGSGRRARPRAGLQGLVKAFQVLEQAALNLYLGPWREEYKVIKMYSGTFTHSVAPVLSAPQIHDLFGLLGYGAAASARGEQLHLRSPPAGAASSDELLRLSCAFFVARCECCLLLAALGKRGGDAKWELSVVRERRRGRSLQDALDNTAKSLDTSQPLMEVPDGELDLYGDESMNGAPAAALGDHESPRSLARVPEIRGSPQDAKMNGDTAAVSSPPEPPAPAAVRSPSAERQERRRPCGESRSDRTEAAAADGERCCSCLLGAREPLQRCFDCDALHVFTCASLDVCNLDNHCVAPVDDDAAAAASVALSDSLGDAPSPPVHPIGFHDCCDLTRLDPQLLCRTCGVFHAAACREKEACQQARHDTRRLGRCSCGKLCTRRPLVLCRYCGSEFCSDCWYRHPVSCSCGQTFDQSSSV